MSYRITRNAFKADIVGEYSDTDTIIELSSVTGLPDPSVVGNYNVILYDTLFGNPADARNGGSYEIWTVTDITGNDLTVIRGQEDTTAITIGDRPFAVLYGATSGWLEDVLDDIDGKVSISDIVNDLTTGGSNVPASAETVKTLNETKAGLTGGNSFTGLQEFDQMPKVGGLKIVESETTTLDFSSDANFSAGTMVFHRIKRGSAEIVSAHATALIEHPSASSRSTASGFLPANFRPNTQIARNVYVLFPGSFIGRIEIATDGTITFDYANLNDGAGTSRLNAGNGVTITYVKA